MSDDQNGYAISYNSRVQTSFRAVASELELVAGEVFLLTLPEPSLADAAVALTAAVQCWLDATAIQNGYDSLASCISYKDSAIVQWASDATAAIAWRDAVWQAAFAWQQSASTSPPATFPTSAEVIAQLPQPGTFGWVAHTPGA